MTPCNNCHGSHDTPPSREALRLLREPIREDSANLPDFVSELAPTVACPAESVWPEGLQDSDLSRQAMPWWVRDNFETARRALHPNASPYRVSVGSAALSVNLGLTEFSVRQVIPMSPFWRWFWGQEFETTHVQGAGNIQSHWTVQDNQLLVPWNSLLLFQSLGMDSPIYNDHPQVFALNSEGDVCLWTQTHFFATPPSVFSPSPVISGGYEIGLNFDSPRVGGGTLDLGLSYYTGSSFPRYCLPVPNEFRISEISEAPASATIPASYDLEDLISRVMSWRQHHPGRNNDEENADRESFLSHLYPEGSPQPVANVFELLRPRHTDLYLDIQDLQDLYLPGLADLGPSQGRLRVRLADTNLLQLTLDRLHLQLDPRALGPLRLDSLQIESLRDLPAVEIRYNVQSHRVEDFSADLHLNARLQWPLTGGREIQVEAYLHLARNAAGGIDFALSDPSIHMPAAGTGPGSFLNRIGETRLEAGLEAAELYGISLMPGLSGTLDLARHEIHLQGNLHLSSELRGTEADRRLRGDLQFYTTLNLDAPGPVPGSTSLRLENLYYENPLPGIDALRNGSVLLSDDPGIFLGEGLQSSHRLEWGLDPLATEPRAYLQARATLGDVFQGEAEGLIPLVRSRVSNQAYDFSQLLRDQPADLSLNLVDLQPEGPGWGPKHRHLSLVDAALRVQRFAEIEGPDLWDLRLQASEAYFGQGRFALELKNLVAGLDIDRLVDEEGDLHFRLPSFEIHANQGTTPDHGVLRGPVDFHLNGSRQGGLEVELDSNRLPTEIRNLDLQFNLQGIDVFPPRARRGLPAGTRYLGLDGHLEGNFEMEYPEDPARWHGRGELRLRGDSGGDIYLLDRHFRRVGPPLLRQSRWRWDRIDGFNWRRAYALGDFHLQTVLNPTVLFGETATVEQGLRVYGGDGQVLRPGELWAEMPYDNQPWSPSGFRNRIIDYLTALCRQDPRCHL